MDSSSDAAEDDAVDDHGQAINPQRCSSDVGDDDSCAGSSGTPTTPRQPVYTDCPDTHASMQRQSTDAASSNDASTVVQAALVGDHAEAASSDDIDLLDMLDAPLPPAGTIVHGTAPMPEPETAAARTRRLQRSQLLERLYLTFSIARDAVANACLNDKVKFNAVVFQDDDAAAVSFMHAIGATGGLFYVGITTSPVWRWRGGFSDNGNYIKGHCDHVDPRWSRMTMFAQRVGGLGKQLETDLVMMARLDYPDTCLNQRGGGGGFTTDPTGMYWLYVCEE